MGLRNQGLSFSAWVVLLCVGGVALVASAQPYELRISKVVDTATPVPGGVGTFEGFGVPTASGFVGQFAGGSGVYGMNLYGGASGLIPVKIADTSTPIPGGTGTFTSFGAPSRGVFRGTGSDGQQGIYLAGSGLRPLSVIADRNTVAPGGGGTFTAFGTGPDSLESDINSFYAETSTGVKGIYRRSSQTITTIADTNTPVPGRGTTTFGGFGGFVGSNGTFLGTVNNKLGVYTTGYGGLQPVLDDTTSIVGPSLPLDTFGGPVRAMSRDGAAFIGSWLAPGTGEAILQSRWFGSDYGAEILARTGDPTPGGRGTEFGDFLAVNHNVGSPEQGPITFFTAWNFDDTAGIYFQRYFNGPIERLIDTTMTLDGKAISSLDMGNGGTDFSYDVSFRVQFADGSSGIYAAQGFVPEPGSAAAGAVAFAALAGLARGRRARATRGR